VKDESWIDKYRAEGGCFEDIGEFREISLLPEVRGRTGFRRIETRDKMKAEFEEKYNWPPLWCITKDGDPSALALAAHHYSWRKYKDGRKRKLFVGPGEKIVLVTPRTDALFVWRKFRSMDNQQGVNCSIFRNESRIRSSLLIEEAVEIAQQRWPGERLYTYVNKKKLKVQTRVIVFCVPVGRNVVKQKAA